MVIRRGFGSLLDIRWGRCLEAEAPTWHSVCMGFQNTAWDLMSCMGIGEPNPPNPQRGVGVETLGSSPSYTDNCF